MTILRVLSFNIHKGFSSFNAKYMLPQLRDKVREHGSDIVFVQEALGTPETPRKGEIRSLVSQYEYLAEGIWHSHAYGKNFVTEDYHHGNAILSRFPIISSKNIDISTNGLERRGVLLSEIRLSTANQKEKTCFCLCTHLSLFGKGRQKQFGLILDAVEKWVPKGAPLILAGDFNDWGDDAEAGLVKPLGLQEAFKKTSGHLARTFPAALPVMKLDRIYSRGFTVRMASCLTDKAWRKLSDHIAIAAEFALP